MEEDENYIAHIEMSAQRADMENLFVIWKQSQYQGSFGEVVREYITEHLRSIANLQQLPWREGLTSAI